MGERRKKRKGEGSEERGEKKDQFGLSADFKRFVEICLNL
jgi:hypothetical protein